MKGGAGVRRVRVLPAPVAQAQRRLRESAFCPGILNCPLVRLVLGSYSYLLDNYKIALILLKFNS